MNLQVVPDDSESVDSTLKRRIVTGLVLAPLAVAAVFLLPNLPFAILFAVITGLAMYEWAGLIVANMRSADRAAMVTLSFMAAFILGVIWLYFFGTLQIELIYLGLFVWVLALGTLWFNQLGFNPFSTTPALAGAGLIIGWAGWLAITMIQARPDGAWWILWIFGIAWGADVGAYFAGKSFGKTKLAPRISPGKTWEGVAGGMLLAGSVCGIGVFLWQDQSWFWLLMTLILIGLSVCGDLFESFVKRQTGVKDSGSLLPGHGGMLDRIDSILIVLPIVIVTLMLQG